MKVQCCDCKKMIGEKPGGNDDDISHTYCNGCFVRFKKQFWVAVHYVTLTGKYYHPWATDGGKFMVYESEAYRGGAIFQKYGEYETMDEMESVCREMNG